MLIFATNLNSNWLKFELQMFLLIFEIFRNFESKLALKMKEIFMLDSKIRKKELIFCWINFIFEICFQKKLAFFSSPIKISKNSRFWYNIQK